MSKREWAAVLRLIELQKLEDKLHGALFAARVLAILAR
jgi:hypothetical protein